MFAKGSEQFGESAHGIALADQPRVCDAPDRIRLGRCDSRTGGDRVAHLAHRLFRLHGRAADLHAVDAEHAVQQGSAGSMCGHAAVGEGPVG
jgi:hypothetical protein